MSRRKALLITEFHSTCPKRCLPVVVADWPSALIITASAGAYQAASRRETTGARPRPRPRRVGRPWYLFLCDQRSAPLLSKARESHKFMTVAHSIESLSVA